MEHVDVEELLKQPKDIQDILTSWWKPEKYDLFLWDVYGFNKVYSVNVYEKGSILPIGSPNIWNDKAQCIPLLTEGQLRKFIEDKTGKRVITGVTFCGDRFVETEDEVFLSYRREEVMDKNLLTSYWKYACRLAKSEIS